MATWAPLRERLQRVSDSITFTWHELDVMVGGLPPSAEQYREFWAGDRSGWPGFRTRNVQIGEQVTFERVMFEGDTSSGRSVAVFSRDPKATATAESDDELVLRAAAATGIADRDALVREGLESLIRLASARELVAFGGTDPAAAVAARRRVPVR